MLQLHFKRMISMSDLVGLSLHPGAMVPGGMWAEILSSPAFCEKNAKDIIKYHVFDMALLDDFGGE